MPQVCGQPHFRYSQFDIRMRVRRPSDVSHIKSKTATAMFFPIAKQITCACSRKRLR